MRLAMRIRKNYWKFIFFIFLIFFINWFLREPNQSIIQEEHTESDLFLREKPNERIIREGQNASDLFLDKKLNKRYDEYKKEELSSNYKTFYDTEQRVLGNKKQITILEYTKIIRKHRFCGLPNNLPKKCAYTNCVFTCDKSLASEADALLMHLTDVQSELNQNKEAKQTLLSKYLCLSFIG